MHPNVSHAMCYSYPYPDGSIVRAGADVEAGKYMAMAMNFTLRPVDNFDGFFGSVVDEETNSFNGMIGMVQRAVK